MVWLVVPRDKYVIVLDFGRHVTRRVHSDETPKGIYSALMKTHKTTHLSRTVSTCELKVMTQKLLALLYSARWSMPFFIVLMYTVKNRISVQEGPTLALFLCWWRAVCMDVGNLPDLPGGLASQYCWKRGIFQCNCPRQDVPVTPDLWKLRDLCPLPLEAIKFLLSVRFEYVFTERFMQDVIEDYFGHQRTQRGRSDNPSA